MRRRQFWYPFTNAYALTPCRALSGSLPFACPCYSGFRKCTCWVWESKGPNKLGVVVQIAG
jgi:hypothetical protein